MNRERLINIISSLATLLSIFALVAQVATMLGASSELLLSIIPVIIVVVISIFSKQIISFANKIDQSKRVFISYSHDAQEYTRTITKALRESGVKIWIDEEQLKPGEPFMPAIERAIKDSDSVIVVLGKTTQKISTELRLAKEQGVKVIPVLIENAEIPSDVADITYIDLRSNLQEGLRKLTKAVS